MFISKKGAQLTNEQFFWDTWYTFFIIFKKFQKASFHEVPETVNTDTMTQI